MYSQFKILFIIILLLSATAGYTQQVASIDSTKNILLLKETSGGIILHSQGWGLKFSKGYNKTAFKKRILSFDIVEIKSLKQVRTINPYFPNSRSYFYGKLNSFFVIRASYGIHRLLNRKPYWGGVEVRFLYMGGFSLGFAKPVYLYFLNTNSFDLISSRSIELYDPSDHFYDNIYGRGPFTKGFGDIMVYPGLHAKIGLDFDYGAYSTKVKSLEIGAQIDIFPNPVPIMAFNDPNYFFLTFYLNFNFGKRYN
jgi:hypothetical protein